MKNVGFAGASLLGTVAAIALHAATASAADEPGRYTMSPTEGGFVRLDRETGAMSMCSGKEGSWTCVPMGDAEGKLKAEIDRLAAENKRLEAETKRLADGSGLPDPGASDARPDGAAPDTGPPGGKIDVPTEKDVDKLFDYMEGMIKKFRERVERLEKENRPGTPL